MRRTAGNTLNRILQGRVLSLSERKGCKFTLSYHPTNYEQGGEWFAELVGFGSHRGRTPLLAISNMYSYYINNEYDEDFLPEKKEEKSHNIEIGISEVEILISYTLQQINLCTKEIDRINVNKEYVSANSERYTESIKAYLEKLKEYFKMRYKLLNK